MTMPTLAETLQSNDLVSAVAGAARGDETKARALIQRARQRAEQRVRDELKRKLDGSAGAHAAATAGARGAATPGAGTGSAAKLEPRLPPPMPPVRSIRIRLPNGRQRGVAVTPALVRHRDLAALCEVTVDNDRRAFQALRRHRRALDELGCALDELAQRVTDLEERSDGALMQLLQQLGNLRGQLKTLAIGQRSTGAAVTQQAKELKSLATSTQIQKVTDVVTSAQVAAFGEKGSVFNKNNLLLAGNQLLWGFIDPLMRLYGLDFGMSPGPMAYLAPLGSLGLGAITVGRTQHERFVADVSTIPPKTIELEVDLLPLIAPADRDAFAARTDVLVTARALDPISFPAPGGPVGIGIAAGGTAGFAGDDRNNRFEATVEKGKLRLTLVDRQADRVRITWLVDTGLGGG